MADSITESIASIVAALVRGQSPRLSAQDLRLLSRVASGSRERRSLLLASGTTVVLAAKRRNQTSSRHGCWPLVFPPFDDDGPQPITPGPYPPDFPQPVTPGPYPPDFPQPVAPPDNPSGPPPNESAFTRPWFEQWYATSFWEGFSFRRSSRRSADSRWTREEIRGQPGGLRPARRRAQCGLPVATIESTTEIGNLGDMFRERVRRVLPLVGQRLGADTRHIRAIDVQMTASNDQEFFVAHVDNGPAFPTRAISYVYFFNREPAAFSGGELTLFHGDSAAQGGSPARFTTIVPAQNQIVFFPSSLLHEVKPLSVPSRSFADSRFTVNGWVHL